jgi:hypothetical protein
MFGTFPARSGKGEAINGVGRIIRAVLTFDETFHLPTRPVRAALYPCSGKKERSW